MRLALHKKVIARRRAVLIRSLRVITVTRMPQMDAGYEWEPFCESTATRLPKSATGFIRSVIGLSPSTPILTGNLKACPLT